MKTILTKIKNLEKKIEKNIRLCGYIIPSSVSFGRDNQVDGLQRHPESEDFAGKLTHIAKKTALRVSPGGNQVDGLPPAPS